MRGRPLPLDQPFDYLLAIPLVLTFALVLGVRAAFAVPADLGANWIFRLAGPRQAAAHAPAAKLACALIAVAPVSGLVIVVGSWLWGADLAMRVAAMHAATGGLLVVIAMAGFAAVPFTRAHTVSASSLKVAAPLGVLAVHVYAFRLDDLQGWALASTHGPAWYVAAMLAATGAAAVAGRWWYGRPPTTFDAPSDHAVRLALSEASH